MTPEDYRDGIAQAYEGELAAERLYRELSRRCEHPEYRAKLAAIADVERCTYTALEPLAAQLRIHPVEATLQAGAERRLPELQHLSWEVFILQAVDEWPPYIVEFTALRQAAPPEHAAVLDLLVKHEQVLVEFVHLERDQPGSSRGLRLLQEFIASCA